MAFEIIRKSSLKVSDWSGGTTTQLAIFPANSEFKDDNYDLRISLASVDAFNTTFTPLKGVKRKLMVIDGAINLEHKGEHKSELLPYCIDEFHGEWQTTCQGRSTNFNLLIKNDSNYKLESLELNEGDSIVLTNATLEFIHIHKGSLLLDDIIISQGDSIVAHHEAHCLIAKEESVAIIVSRD